MVRAGAGNASCPARHAHPLAPRRPTPAPPRFVEQVLTRQQAELVALERRLVLQVRDSLGRAEGARADLERLARLVTEMDELFL